MGGRVQVDRVESLGFMGLIGLGSRSQMLWGLGSSIGGLFAKLKFATRLSHNSGNPSPAETLNPKP